MSFFVEAVQAQGVEGLGERLEFVSPTGHTAHLKCLAYGEGKLVAGGEQGTLVVSDDAGDTWRGVALGLTRDEEVRSITYGNGRFVAVLSRYGLLTSTVDDLDSWSLVGVSNFSNPIEVAYLNGQFFLVGGGLATSSDGIHWQALTSVPEDAFQSIAYGAGVYVIVGGGGLIYSSSDLQTWFLEDSDTEDLAPRNGFNHVRYSGDRFLAAGINGILCSSDDGSRWSRTETGLSAFLFDAAFFKDYYWIMGNGSSFLRSKDLVTWERVVHPGNENNHVFALGDGVLYGAGRYGTLLRTLDGETWENLQKGVSTENFAAIAFGSGRFVAATFDGSLFASADGETWELVFDDDAWSIQDLVFQEDHFLAVGSSGPIRRSADGFIWEKVGETPWRVEASYYRGGDLIIGGFNGQLARSSDLSDWEDIHYETDAYISGVTYGNGRYVAVGSGGLAIAAGPDFQWEVATQTPDTSNRSAVTFHDGQFIATGLGNAWRSTDGLNWEVMGFGASVSNRLLDIDGDLFALGYLGYFHVLDNDGVSWRSEGTYNDASFTGIAYGNGRWVTVGNYGSIMVARDDEARRWRIFLGVDGDGRVDSSMPLDGLLDDNTSLMLTARPSEGNIFDYWEGVDADESTPTITVNSNRVIVAHFVPTPSWAFSWELVGGEGTVTVDPAGGPYTHGTEITVTAVPAPGYEFSRWQGSASSRENPLSLTVLQDLHLRVTFREIPVYTLATNAQGDGAVSVEPLQDSYPSGTEITATATPADGFAFVRWTGTVTSVDNPLTFSIARHTTLNAVFEESTTTYPLTIRALGGGRVEVSPDGDVFVAGTQVTLTPHPDEGSLFLRWTGAAGGNAVPLTFTMDGAKSVTAEFISAESYEGWSMRYFGEADGGGRSADPDGDGYSNEAEYAWASDPLAAHSVPSVETQLVWEDGVPHMVLTWNQAIGVDTTLEATADLLRFSTLTPADYEILREETADGRSTLTVRMKEAVSDIPWKGLRLRGVIP